VQNRLYYHLNAAVKVPEAPISELTVTVTDCNLLTGDVMLVESLLRVNGITMTNCPPYAWDAVLLNHVRIDASSR
jgi:hypothetical protein